MHEDVIRILVVVAQLLEIVGAVSLIAGFILATVLWVRRIPSQGGRRAAEGYRRLLARVVLIGLEILVAATIIKTLTVEPTLESLGLLAFMILIRTMLSWTAVLEMTGRWPWQKVRTNAAGG